MAHIKFDYSKLTPFVAENELDEIQWQIDGAAKLLHEGKGAGSDYIGWLDLPEDYDKEEFARIQKAAKKIQSDSEVLIVIGIGGSYLGARAAIDFLSNSFVNLQTAEERKAPRILYAGNSISSSYLADLVDYVADKDFSVNVISKSGTTTEPAIAFRVFEEMLVKKYGREEANKRIYATTDKEKGAVKVNADANNWETFVVPDSVGGRFSGVEFYSKPVRSVQRLYGMTKPPVSVQLLIREILTYLLRNSQEINNRKRFLRCGNTKGSTVSLWWETQHA